MMTRLKPDDITAIIEAHFAAHGADLIGMEYDMRATAAADFLGAIAHHDGEIDIEASLKVKPVPPSNEGMFYLQDARSFVGNCVVWWAKGGKGYTTRLSEANLYTKVHAEGQHQMRETDVPWLCSMVDPLAAATVDMQYLYKARAALESAKASS